MKRGLVVGMILTAAVARPAEAFNPSTTHAGLTERAALSSSLARQLIGRFGHAMGLFELLRLEVPGERGEQLRARLARLDPAGGVSPDDGKLPALGWLLAGTVVEETPPDRGRNHFYDPLLGRGLDQGGVLDAVGYRLAAAQSGLGSVRGLFSATAFDGTGAASTEWLTSAENDLGQACFLAARRRAVDGATAAERESALAEALLCAGAMLHVVEDAGDPAHVHNDFRVSLFDDGAPLSRYASGRYGRLAVPAPAGPPRTVARLAELITSADGSGLADRTARSFYSEGLLPYGPSSSSPPPEENAARPGLPPLVAGLEPFGYVYDSARRRIARWDRQASGMVRWSLDERCLADAAAALLPEAGQAAASALEHLFRGSLIFDGKTLRNGPLPLGEGEVVLLLEEEDGKRRVVGKSRVSSAAPGDSLTEIADSLVDQPLVALFVGVDGNKDPLVVSADAKHSPAESPAPPPSTSPPKIEPEPAPAVEEKEEPAPEPAAPPPVEKPAPPSKHGASAKPKGKPSTAKSNKPKSSTAKSKPSTEKQGGSSPKAKPSPAVKTKVAP